MNSLFFGASAGHFLCLFNDDLLDKGTDDLRSQFPDISVLSDLRKEGIGICRLFFCNCQILLQLRDALAKPMSVQR